MYMCTQSFGGVKQCPLHLSLLGGCWKIRLLLRSLWKGAGSWLKVFCVVFVGGGEDLSSLIFWMQNSLVSLMSLFYLAWSDVSESQWTNVNFFFFQCNTTDSVNDVWGAVWIVVISEIWKHMNNVIFKLGVGWRIKIVRYDSIKGLIVLNYLQITLYLFFLSYSSPVKLLLEISWNVF